MSIEDDKKSLQDRYARQTDEQTNLLQKTNSMTSALFKGMNDILDVSTGGFLRPTDSTVQRKEEENKQDQMNPVMTQQQQENIKQMLTKIDQLLTMECILCGDFLLDLVGSAVIPDDPSNKAVVELVDQNSYMIDLQTGFEAQRSIVITQHDGNKPLKSMSAKDLINTAAN